MSENLIKPSQAAKICGVTPEAVRIWIKQGKLPAFKMKSGSIRIKESEVYKFLGQPAE